MQLIKTSNQNNNFNFIKNILIALMNSFHNNFNIGILNWLYKISSRLCWNTKPITVYFLMKRRIITAKYLLIC